MRRLKRLGLKLSVMILSIVFSLLLAEQFLVWIGYDYKPLAIVTHNLDTRSDLVFEDEHFEYDPELIWRPKRDQSVFNAQGFRGVVLPSEKPKNSFWIFAVGDSNTLGWQGEEGPNWPLSLNRRLRSDCDCFEVVNAGVWGYSSYQGLIRLKEVLKYRPDMVFVSFGSNDAHPVGVPDKEYGSSVTKLRLEKILQRYRLGRLVMGASMQWTAFGADAFQHRVSLEDYRENLEEMVRLSLAQGAQVVLFTRPYIGSIPEVPRWKSYAHDYNAATAGIAAKHGLPLVDLYAYFKDRENLFDDESHFNGEGHELAAEIVHRHIQPLIRRGSMSGGAERISQIPDEHPKRHP
jgi:lysophospholipase L1-like esterase